MPSKIRALRDRVREQMLRAQSGPTPLRILRIRDVRQKTGMPISTIYAWMREGRFPVPVRLGPKVVGWPEHELEVWLQGKIVERDKVAS
jgi:prophage regulatory protein